MSHLKFGSCSFPAQPQTSVKDNHILNVFLPAVAALVVGTAVRVFDSDRGDLITIASFCMMVVALRGLCWKYRHLALKQLGVKKRA